MTRNRLSINRVARELSELVLEGGAILPAHKTLAESLLKLAGGGGVYRKKYESEEERVLNRHLNLYRNKHAAAKTAGERAHWWAKIVAQEEKIDEWQATRPTARVLDLDGL